MNHTHNTHNCSPFLLSNSKWRKGSEDEGLKDPAERDLDLDDEPPGSPLLLADFLG